MAGTEFFYGRLPNKHATIALRPVTSRWIEKNEVDVAPLHSSPRSDGGASTHSRSAGARGWQ